MGLWSIRLEGRVQGHDLGLLPWAPWPLEHQGWSRGAQRGWGQAERLSKQLHPCLFSLWIRTEFWARLWTIKNLPAMWVSWVRSLGQEAPLEKGMATPSSILAWRIPWTGAWRATVRGVGKTMTRLSN